MQNQILTRALILFFSITVTFLSCERIDRPKESRTAKGGVVAGGTLKLPINKIPAALMPCNMVGPDAASIGVHLYDGLVRLDPFTAEVIPGIAESWSVDNAGTGYVFNLRRGVKFHGGKNPQANGREVVAADVLYSLEQLAKGSDSTFFKATIGGRLLGSDVFRKGNSETIEGVQVVDDYTLKLQLTKPDQSFLYVLAQPALGIISEESAEETIGAGPYEFVSGDGSFLLVRNSDYDLRDEFGNRYPYIDTLIFVELSSNTERLEAFFDGKIDLVTNLELDPVRFVLDKHMADFSGKSPKYVMERETENASFETYSVYRSGLKDIGSGFMGYRDFSRTQFEQ